MTTCPTTHPPKSQDFKLPRIISQDQWLLHSNRTGDHAYKEASCKTGKKLWILTTTQVLKFRQTIKLILSLKRMNSVSQMKMKTCQTKRANSRQEGRMFLIDSPDNRTGRCKEPHKEPGRRGTLLLTLTTLALENQEETLGHEEGRTQVGWIAMIKK